jgi:hypothetical protein
MTHGLVVDRGDDIRIRTVAAIHIADCMEHFNFLVKADYIMHGVFVITQAKLVRVIQKVQYRAGVKFDVL